MSAHVLFRFGKAGKWDTSLMIIEQFLLNISNALPLDMPSKSVENGTMDAAKQSFVECAMSVALDCQAPGASNAWKANVSTTAHHGMKRATGFCRRILHWP